MSDNIPVEIQLEIIKKVSDVKSLIKFRSVSKPWKSFIDSSEFIKGYGARHTQPRSLILSYRPRSLKNDSEFICLVDDDDIETFKVQFAPFVFSPLLKQGYSVHSVVGACHGLLCLYGFHRGYQKVMVVIWNPSIRKSSVIAVPRCPLTVEVNIVYGFGVCPVTSDPTVIRVLCAHNKPWQVEVFTLSSGVWNVIPSANLPRQSIQLNSSIHVVIDRFIYWGACEIIPADGGRSMINHMVVSFDLITKDFKVVDLPRSLTDELNGTRVSVLKLRESLVVYGSIFERAEACSLWVMQHDSSFRKLFTIGSPICQILGFRNNGETIFRIAKELGPLNTLDVYDPSSQQIKNLGIRGVMGFFFMDSYKESLLLLDHSDLHIYSDDS